MTSLVDADVPGAAVPSPVEDLWTRLEVTSQEMEGNVALTRDQEQAYVTTLRCILSDPRVIPSSGFQPNHYALFISTFLARRR